MIALDPTVVRRLVRAALDEDLDVAGDLTTAALFVAPVPAAGHLVARQSLVLAGLALARETFRQLDPALEFVEQRADGERAAAGERLATVRGDARPILAGERTALNFLMRMCGIATAASSAVAEVAGTRTRILDTRKTAPGLRLLDKYAVAVGGADNHRLGLYDAILVKDTHLAAGCSIAEAVARARACGNAPAAIAVEVSTVAALEQAIAAGAGRALLDNMGVAELTAAVRLAAGRIVLEASGGLRPGGLRAVAESGVDFLSLGWLTHSAAAANVAMDLERLT